MPPLQKYDVSSRFSAFVRTLTGKARVSGRTSSSRRLSAPVQGFPTNINKCTQSAHSDSPHRAAAQAGIPLENLNAAANSLQGGIEIALCCLFKHKVPAEFDHFQHKVGGETLPRERVSLEKQAPPLTKKMLPMRSRATFNRQSPKCTQAHCWIRGYLRTTVASQARINHIFTHMVTETQTKTTFKPTRIDQSWASFGNWNIRFTC